MEIWRNIERFDHHQISNKGNLRSLDRIIINSSRLYKRKTFLKGKVKETRTCKNGYVRYSVSLDGERYHGTIHRLVSEAFINNSLKLPCVNHIDGDKSNNKSENLEWCTYKENSQHAIDLGLINQVGENSTSSKFTKKQVDRIRKRMMNGERNKDLAVEFKVSKSTITRIKNREVYI